MTAVPHRALLAALVAAAASACGVAFRDPAAPTVQRTPSPEAYEQFVLGAIAVENGDAEAAALHFDSAVALDPDDPLLRVEHAKALAACGHGGAARREALRALLVEPAFEAAWVVLAELHAASGDGEEAERTALDGIRAVPDGGEILLWLARHYRAAGETERALEVARRAAAADPELAEADAEIASLAAGAGRIDEATERLTAYGTRRPADALLIGEVARAAAAAGRTAESIALLEAASRADGADTALRASLVEQLLAAGLLARARDRLLEMPAPGDDAELVQRVRWLLAAHAPWDARRLVGERTEAELTAPELRLAAAEIELALKREEAAALLLEPPKGGWPAELAERARALRLRATAP